jgi:hypothetical protein
MAEFKYREYRLSVETHTPGLKIVIYPPGASLPLSTIPFHRDRTKLSDLLQEARRLVDDHQSAIWLSDAAKEGVRPDGSNAFACDFALPRFAIVAVHR